MFKLIKFELKKLLNIKRIILIFLIVLLSSFGVIKFSEFLYNRGRSDDIIINLDSVFLKEEARIEQLNKQYEADPNPNNLWLLKREEKLLDYYKYMDTLNFVSSDWRGEILNNILQLSLEEITLNMYLDGIDMSKLTVTSFGYTNKNFVENRLAEIEIEKNKLKDILENGKYYNYIKTLVDDQKEKIKLLSEEMELLKNTAVLPNYNAVSRLKSLAEEKQKSEATLKIYNYIIENKIEDHHDWRYMVIRDIDSYLYLQYEILDTEEEFQYNPNKGTMYLTYEDYLNSNLSRIESAKKRNQENWYYLENNIKPLNTVREMPYTTRLSMNNVYFMGIIALIITAIMCGGIVANEHKTGSIRLLLTKPFKRWKILLSKLLVTILMFLLIYLMGIIVTYLLSGILYGFNDFTIPLLVNNSGSISTISYIGFTCVNILKSIVIIILLINLLFAMASITLHTPITLSIILILIFILTFIPYVITFNNSFTYFPIFLLNFHEVIYSGNNAFANLNINTSILYSLIYSIVILGITFVIYCKRDVKN